MKFGGKDADQEAKVRTLRIDMGNLVVGTGHGLGQDTVDMCAQRSDELVEDIEYVFLELVNRQSDKVHEIDQLGRFEVRKQIRHQRWDELCNIGPCGGKDPSKGEACLQFCLNI